jgi:serine/threonine-protein kinase/endoribonuclease IRE1
LFDQIWYCKDHIATGSFGLIFAGINEKDGREVAVKRIEKLRMKQPEDKREIKNLTALADCEQAVRYISFFEDEHFSYIVLELMEGNLEEYLHGSKIDATQATPLCTDVVMGLKFLHGQNIVHRDLKPENILYKVHPKICLKIADFGQSRNMDSGSTTVYRARAGTRCWIAPEVLTSKSVEKDRFTPASDMFSCGLLLYYILSGQKHPFYPTDYESKEKTDQLIIDTEANMMRNTKMKGWTNSLPPEATYLITRMLQSNEKDRPSAEKALEHPLFWSKGKKIDFLKAVSDQKEFPYSPLKWTLKRSCILANCEDGSWLNKERTNLIHEGMIKGKGRNDYNDKSVVELVRFIRNVYVHYEEKTFSKRAAEIEKMLFKDFVFLNDFPDLLIEVYEAVITHGWDKKEGVKFAMNKK